jgi:anti-sigma-K factor RskA
MANEYSHSEKFEKLCAGYVLNALNEAESKEFEKMLSDASEEERIFYQSMQSAANQLAFTVEGNEPSEALKERLMEHIRSKDDSDQQESSAIDEAVEFEEDGINWGALTAAASFALLIISLSLIFYSFSLNSKVNNKEEVISQQKTKITELETELQQKKEMLAILEAREVAMIVMSGMEINPNGYGKVIWDSEKQQALLQVSNLPSVPSNKDYQLWLIKNNKPVSVGVFTVNTERDTFFKIEKIVKADEQSANAFAITMEPKGGMPQPTGDMYLMGSMDKKSKE